MNFSTHDTRPTAAKELNLKALDLIQEVLETSIASYAIEQSENLYDVEHQEIIRRLVFSQGTRSYELVICPDGFLRMATGKFPLPLMLEIHNALIKLFVEEA